MQGPSHINPELALEEELDSKDPLRHLMEVESDGLVAPAKSSTHDQLLSFLPAQSHSIEDGILRLSFLHPLENVPRPLNLVLAVDASPGCGGVAWPAGQILATYLIQKGPEYLRNRNVLELGAGTGLVGLVAGLVGDCNVWITDQKPLLATMRRNVLLNNVSTNVTVAELDWGSPPPPDIPRPDIILAADCVYFEPAFPLLVQTLADLSNGTTEILFCYKKRRKADKRFFGMLKKRFTWKEVLDDPNREAYSREAITLMRLLKLK